MNLAPVNLSVSVVVPVYHSEASLEELIRRLGEVLEAHFPAFEVLLIDDGSTDQSWAVITRLAASRSWVRGIQLMRNYGQHNALLCGIRAARHEIIVTLDDDLQHPPEEIPRLVRKLQEGFDVVYGSPRKRQHGFWRDSVTHVTKRTLKHVMGIELACEVSAFRAIRAGIRQAFAQYQGALVSIDVLLTWATSRFGCVAVRHDPRRAGQSHYTLRRLITYTMNLITGFSTAPLRLATLVGFFFALFGFGILAYVVGRYFIEGGSVPGFPFLASIVAILSGAQLFAIGILGEYLARMHVRLMERPPYAIQKTLNFPGEVIRYHETVGAAESTSLQTELANP